MKLTPNTIAGIRATEKRQMIKDDRQPGLYLIVQPSGVKTWAWYMKVGKKIATMTLGRYPSFSIAEAREWAEARTVERDRGHDPRALLADALAAEQAAKTAEFKNVGYWFDQYLDGPCKNQASRYDKKRAMEKDFITDKIKVLALTDLTYEHCHDAVRAVYARGAGVGGNRLVMFIKGFLRWCAKPAQRRETNLTHSPAIDLECEFEEQEVDRFLSIYESALMIRAARDVLDADMADALTLLALTGVRKAEVLKSQPHEYRDGVWHQPTKNTKTKKFNRLPLASIGREIFEKRRNGVWMFPAPKGEGKKPRTTAIDKVVMPKVRARMVELAGHKIEWWTLHALRRGFKTETKEHGVASIATVEKIMNHADASMEARYDKTNGHGDKAMALEDWQALIVAEIARQEAKARAIPLAA
jgi:integrase